MQKYKVHALATGDSTFKGAENTTLLQELSAYVSGSHIVYGAGTLWEELAVIESTKACWQFFKGTNSIHTHKTVRPCVLKRHYDQQRCEEERGYASHGHFDRLACQVRQAM